jgi:hypothetical protein
VTGSDLYFNEIPLEALLSMVEAERPVTKDAVTDQRFEKWPTRLL